MRKFFKIGVIAALIAIMFVGCGGVSGTGVVESNVDQVAFKGANIKKTKDGAIISFGDKKFSEKRSITMTLSEEIFLKEALWSISEEEIYIIDEAGNYKKAYEELIIGERYTLMISSKIDSMFVGEVLHGETSFIMSDNIFIDVSMELSEITLNAKLQINNDTIIDVLNKDWIKEESFVIFDININENITIITEEGEYNYKLTPAKLLNAIQNNGKIILDKGYIIGFSYSLNSYNISEKTYFSSIYKEELPKELINIRINIDEPVIIYFSNAKDSDAYVRVYDSNYNLKEWQNGSTLEVGDIVELSYNNTINLDFELYFDQVSEIDDDLDDLIKSLEE